MYSSQVAGRGPGQLEACGSKVHGYWLKAALQIALLLAIPGIAVAQFTQVSGTVVDPNGIAYANGTIMPTLVISGSPRFAATGLPYTPPTTPSGLDSQGRFVMQLADVNQLIPAGGVWTFTVNCTGGCIPPGVGVGPVTFTTTGIVITGTAMDISSVLDAAAPPLTTGGGGGVHINGSPTSSPNFNSTTPPPPANSAPILFQVSGSNVSAALEGDGNGNNCFHGDGLFKPCGVTSIDSLTGPFNFTGGVTCTAGTPNVCNFTGGGGGSTALSSLTAAVAPNTISNGDNSQVWNWSLATANNTGLNISESTPSTATGSSLVKISQPTSGSTAVALTVQSGSTTAAIPAFQIQGTTGTNAMTVGSSGTVSATGPYQSLLAGAQTQLCGGLCVTSNSGQIGGARVRGSDNTAASAAGGSGFAIIAGGGLTNASPLSTQVNSVTQLASAYLCVGTCGLGTVVCATGILDQVTNCNPTPQSAVIGVSEGFSGATAWIVSAGSAQVFVDNTAVVGHTVCTSTTTAGMGTDSGSTGPCIVGQQIGVVMAVSGATSIPSGIASVTTSFTASAPKVALADLARRATTNPLTLPLATASLPSLTGTSTGGFGLQFAANCCSVSGVPSIWTNGANVVNAANWQPIPWISINGGGPANVNNQNFTHAGGTGEPTLPANAVSMTWARTGATGAGLARQDISAYLLGDGSTNCLSGQGTYVACGSATGTGTVGSGVAGQFAFYTGTNTVQGTANLTNNLGNIATIVPFELISPSALPPPVAGANLLTVDQNGVLQYSQNGGAFAPIAGGTATGVTSINGATGALTFPNVLCTTGTCPITNPLLIPGSALPAIPAGNAGFGATPVGLAQFNSNNTGWRFITTTNINGAAVAQNLVNFNNTNPAAPAGTGLNVTWQTINGNTSAYLPTSGNATDCFLGNGTFATCPGGSGGGIGGSGTAGTVPVFTGATSLGNSLITASPQIIFFGTSGNPLIPNNATTSNAGLVANVKEQVPSCLPSGSTAGPAFAPIGVGDVGCFGSFENYSGDSATSNGVSAGFMVAANSSSNNATGTLGLGIASILSPGAGTTELRAGYFQSESTGGISTNNRGVFAAAFNTGSGVSALPLNEAIVAQTGNLGAAGLSAGPTTADYTVHCLAPNNIGSQVLMTNHACLKIEPQGTGVELQTGAHVFANLPACSTAYEGSLAAITDSTVTSGTVAGGGTNHVLTYCNGANWTVSGGGGGTGPGTSDLTCTTNQDVTFSNSGGNATICTFTLAASHNYMIRCVYPVSFGTQSTSAVSDVDVGIHVVNGPANITYFRGTFFDPSGTFAPQASVSGVTGTAGNGGVANSFNLMRAMNIGSSPPNTTTNQEGFAFTIDGVYPTGTAGDTLIFYIGSSLAGSGGVVLPGAYCRLE